MEGPGEGLDVCTAIAFLVQDEQQIERINAVRRKYDRAFPRWSPHVNLLFPFVPETQFEDVAARLEASKLKEVAAFEVTLEEFASFKQGKDKLTFNLQPSKADAKKMTEVFDIVRHVIPEAPPKHMPFKPHLTLGQCSKTEAADREREVRETVGPLRWTIDSVCLIARPLNDKNGKFAIKKVIHLLKK